MNCDGVLTLFNTNYLLNELSSAAYEKSLKDGNWSQIFHKKIPHGICRSKFSSAIDKNDEKNLAILRINI